MQSVEVTAKTVEEAIELALKQLGVDRGEVEVVVLSKGKAGILGLGAEFAKVKASVLPPPSNVVALARELLEELLKTMGVSAAVFRRDQPAQGDEEDSTAVLDIQGDDSGLLIGRRGETLATLQFLVNFMLQRHLKARARVVIDVEGYRERREKALRELALRIAERVKSRGRSITLEPMPARERRIVHLALAEHPDVTTTSIGEDEDRKVTILPKRE